MNDLRIYYSSMAGDHYMDCKCSRWDVDGYSLIVETWLKKSNLQELRNHIAPNAVDELYEILGVKHYFDITWQGANTLMLSPIAGSQLDLMRGQNKVVFVKSITDNCLPGTSGWINVKLECLLSSNSEL